MTGGVVGGGGLLLVSNGKGPGLVASHPAMHRVVLHSSELSHVPILGECLIGYSCR